MLVNLVEVASDGRLSAGGTVVFVPEEGGESAGELLGGAAVKLQTYNNAK